MTANFLALFFSRLLKKWLLPHLPWRMDLYLYLYKWIDEYVISFVFTRFVSFLFFLFSLLECVLLALHHTWPSVKAPTARPQNNRKKRCGPLLLLCFTLLFTGGASMNPTTSIYIYHLFFPWGLQVFTATTTPFLLFWRRKGEEQHTKEIIRTALAMSFSDFGFSHSVKQRKRANYIYIYIFLMVLHHTSEEKS